MTQDGAGVSGTGARPRVARVVSARRGRLLAWVVLWAQLVAVAAITLWPSPVDEAGRPALLRALEQLHARGMPQWIDYAFVERASNVVMFVPYGAALAVLLPLRRWWLAVAVPAATSLLVEMAQHVALPRRVASAEDVLANAAGAMVGVALVALAVVLRRRREHVGPSLTRPGRPS